SPPARSRSAGRDECAIAPCKRSLPPFSIRRHHPHRRRYPLARHPGSPAPDEEHPVTDVSTIAVPTPSRPSRYQHRRLILRVICLALVMFVAGVSMLAGALPTLAADLDASQSSQQWIVDAYALVLAALLLPAGAIGDRFGRRGALIAGTGIFAIASVLSA